MPLGQLELALRVIAGLFVIVAPTLLFLGLWRGLEAMRDDELIRQAQQRAEMNDRSSTGPNWSADALTNDAAAPLSETNMSVVICGSCGTPNMQDATYCQECFTELE
ncbi:zinc ribbon domain-containing protein [Haloarcula sp. CBA1130]|uniref:zinc ribbon domain-containing protein n=1 Tax=unclassified Haloarcula TaxID=2624677 RepID=UPI00124549B2|nr:MULTISPECIES: zinc ribbon domain-containing protein [unclassified Haloarcula]KAA9399409.1 zinc ribbon domain-containing protein [Haloarcula sp. CBA1129]KAA9403925.1 zinc ribbon domain-containing protein [Haloarcula sp. CBA1130]